MTFLLLGLKRVTLASEIQLLKVQKMSWRFGRRKHNTCTFMLVAKLEPTSTLQLLICHCRSVTVFRFRERECGTAS